MAEIIWRQKAKQRLRDVLAYAYNRFGPMTARKMERRIKDRIDTRTDPARLLGELDCPRPLSLRPSRHAATFSPNDSTNP